MTLHAGDYAEVIGDPISQSKSPSIHRYWLQQLGRVADYKACPVSADDLADYIAERRQDADWAGCNVTMPHKQAVMPLVDTLDGQAESIGAVNTIVPDGDGNLTGFNTDGAGFLEPLRADIAQRHLFRMARVMGTGGAARAIVRALADEGFTIVLSGRDPEKARALLDELDPGREHHVAPLSHFAQPTDFEFDDREGCLDLVVNASPLGMQGQPPLDFDFSHVPPGSIIYDIVTTPMETPFLQAARAKGFRNIDGLSMLIGQAAVAFEKFFGIAPPREENDVELRRMLTR
ncbi:shikimate dehydrogenase [Aurantiacibacter rhizosphaerae]|uniref:Shikimate dehydrogenase (NADP(+)) n=1 Tax=Aurantiacibacter rhizosphaerae TaxID=2691582 RepID=A0A844X9A6_9SPHN|nr:shikimate dehydrogenase [Aurantiacibacter rhizosphaerae]MWV26342.1 shikimate dehydrogenase [Aurantiacibacter rhizosphaerae]